MTTDDVSDPDGALGVLADATTCRLATYGRRTGREHLVTVWFALVGTRVYVASRHGLEGDWLQNALAGEVYVRHRQRAWPGTARLVIDPDETGRVVERFASKYARHQAVVNVWRADPPVFVRIDLDLDIAG